MPGRVGWLAMGFFGEKTNCLIRRLKYDYMSQHFYDMCKKAPFWAFAPLLTLTSADKDSDHW